MLNSSFALFHQSTLTCGGLLFLILSTLFITYRLTAHQQNEGGQHTAAQNTLAPLAEMAHLYLSTLAPWILTLVTARSEGYGPYTYSSVSYAPSVFFQLIIISISFLLLLSIALTNAMLFCKRWAWEILCSVLCLQYCWVLIAGAHSLLSTLLWLEIASLCALLLLTFSSIGQLGHASLFSSWRASYVSRQIQLGFLSAVLAFLWAGGLSTLLLLLAFCHVIAAGGGVTFTELAIGVLQGTPSENPSSLLWACLAAGFLIKLMLQPFQFFLLSFYRRLTLFALIMYIMFYYIFLVPSVVFIFGPALSLLLPGWFILLVGSLVACVGLLGGALTSSTDLRSVLAFSTIVNLSILLMSLSVGV